MAYALRLAYNNSDNNDYNNIENMNIDNSSAHKYDNSKLISSINDKNTNRTMTQRKKKKEKKLGRAYMIPASDGGYAMLCLPSHACPLRTFRGASIKINKSNGVDSDCQFIRWSDPLTALSQLKALTDQDDINVTIGTMRDDIDDKNDLVSLSNRLIASRLGSSSSRWIIGVGSGGDSNNSKGNNDFISGKKGVLERGPSGESPYIPASCSHTFEALVQLKVVVDESNTIKKGIYL